MSWPAAFCVVGIVATFFTCAVLNNQGKRDYDRVVSIACIQAGGQWKKTRWYSEEECVR